MAVNLACIVNELPAGLSKQVVCHTSSESVEQTEELAVPERSEKWRGLVRCHQFGSVEGLSKQLCVTRPTRVLSKLLVAIEPELSASKVAAPVFCFRRLTPLMRSVNCVRTVTEVVKQVSITCDHRQLVERS